MTGDIGSDLRAANADDLEAVAGLFLTCWRTAYHEVLPARLVAMYDDASARELWSRSLGVASERDVLVAEEHGGRVVGVITIGEDLDLHGTGHIFSLYVHPERQGHGIGTRLLSAAIDRFRTDGLSRASLFVFAANAAARAFYARLGWVPDGRTRVEPAYGEPEVRLTRPI